MENICIEFHRNPTSNPRTGRQIKIGGPTYTALVAECGVPPNKQTQMVIPNYTVPILPSFPAVYTIPTLPPLSPIYKVPTSPTIYKVPRPHPIVPTITTLPQISPKFNKLPSPKVPMLPSPQFFPKVTVPTVSPTKIPSPKIVPMMTLQKTAILNKLANYKLIIFDFDCTISRKHTCSGIFLKVEDIVPDTMDIYIGADNAKVFKEFITDLLSLGKMVAIASYGNKAVIIKLLDSVFSPDPNPFNEDNIVTPADISVKFGINWLECYEPPVGYNKNNMLMYLQTKYTLANGELLLLDDTTTVVTNALFGGFPALNTPRCQGFTSVRDMVLGF